MPIDDKDYPKASELTSQIDAIKEDQWHQGYSLLSDEDNWKYLKGIEATSSNSTKYEVVQGEIAEEFRTVGTISRDTNLTIRSRVPEGVSQLTAVRFTLCRES